MITVIEETKDEVLDCGKYAEMNLAEACHQFEIDNIQLVNEFEMSVLLSEHAYLMENGKEIEYVTEAEKGAFKEKVVGMLSKAGEAISELFNRLINWVVSHVQEVTTWLAEKSISKKHIEKAKEALGAKSIKGKMKYTIKDEFFADVEGEKIFKEPIDSWFDNLDNKIDLVSKYEEAGKEIDITAAVLDDAKDIIFNSKNILKKIKDAKNSANKSIKEAIKRVKSEDPDNVGEVIQRYKACINYNSKAARDCIKIYHDYIMDQIGICRTVFADAGIRKAIAGANVVKAAENVGKAAANVANTAEKVGEGAKKGAEAVGDAASKAGKAVGNAARNAVIGAKFIAKGTGKEKKEKATNESVKLFNIPGAVVTE